MNAPLSMRLVGALGAIGLFAMAVYCGHKDYIGPTVLCLVLCAACVLIATGFWYDILRDKSGS